MLSSDRPVMQSGCANHVGQCADIVTERSRMRPCTTCLTGKIRNLESVREGTWVSGARQ